MVYMFVIFLFLTGCATWSTHRIGTMDLDFSGNFQEDMDLMRGLEGLSVSQLIELLGEPSVARAGQTIHYEWKLAVVKTRELELPVKKWKTVKGVRYTVRANDSVTMLSREPIYEEIDRTSIRDVVVGGAALGASLSLIHLGN